MMVVSFTTLFLIIGGFLLTFWFGFQAGRYETNQELIWQKDKEYEREELINDVAKRVKEMIKK
jgi:hypothetical protein